MVDILEPSYSLEKYSLLSLETDLQLKEVNLILNKYFHGKARILFASVAGSRSFNLNMPDSDSDLFGVYVLDSDEVASSIPLRSKFTVISSHDPDYTLYEVHTFCELLLKGNPKVIEPLFQSRLCHWEKDGFWEELLQMKEQFLTSTVLEQYVGFAKSQLYDSTRGKGVVTKKYYHALRLLREAKRIANFGCPAVWLDGEEREYLMAVRRNEIDSEVLDKELKMNFNVLYRKLEDVEFKTKLDENKSAEELVDLLNPWLVKLRRKVYPKAVSYADDSLGHPLYEMVMNELKHHGINGRILCCCLSGSHLHLGDDGNDSLPDYIAVYACETDEILGLRDPIIRIAPQSDDEIRDTYTRGLAIHEISNICNLIQQGNHRIMEILFSDREDDYITPLWNQLKENRNNFITQVVTNHYQGVARGQLVATVNPEKKGGLLKKQLHHVIVSSDDVKDTKDNRIKLYHALRLFSMASKIVDENTIPFILEGEQGKIIKGIKSGTTSIEKSVSLANELCKQVENLKSKLNSVPRRLEARYSTSLQKYLQNIRILQ